MEGMIFRTSTCSTTPNIRIIPPCASLIQHDDLDREFDYQSGAEKALDRAASSGWTVVSIKNDWATVF
jgi:hypothetical protein